MKMDGERERVLFLAGAGDYQDMAGDPDNGSMRNQDVLDPFRTLDEGGQAVLWAVSGDHGRLLTNHKLDNMLVFDGMAAANGQLYITNTAGEVLSLREP